MILSICLLVLASTDAAAVKEPLHERSRVHTRAKAEHGDRSNILVGIEEEDETNANANATAEEASSWHKQRGFIKANAESAHVTFRRLGSLVREGFGRPAKKSADQAKNFKSVEKTGAEEEEASKSGDSDHSMSWLLLLVCLGAVPVLVACLIVSAYTDHADEKEAAMRQNAAAGIVGRQRSLGSIQRQVPPARPSALLPPPPGSEESLDSASLEEILSRTISSPTTSAGSGNLAQATAWPSPPSLPMVPQGLPPLTMPQGLPMIGDDKNLCPTLMTTDPYGLLMGVPVSLQPFPEKMVCDIKDLERDQVVMCAFFSEIATHGIMISDTHSSAPVAFLETAKAVRSGGQDNRHVVLRRAANGGTDAGSMPYAVIFLQDRGPGGCTLVARRLAWSRGPPILAARVGDDGIVLSIQDSVGRTVAVADSSFPITPFASSSNLGQPREDTTTKAFRVFQGADAGLVLCAIIAAQKLW